MAELARINDPQKALTGYSEEKVQQFASLVKRVAPWAKDMDNQGIGLAVRRALSMGLDPLNPHEVQIWKDWRGNLNFQLAYTLLAEWIKRKHGDHTEPQYERLTPDQLEDEGLQPDDVAYRVKFIMKSDLPTMRDMLSMQVFDVAEVRAMFEVVGLGVAEAKEYNRTNKKWIFR